MENKQKKALSNFIDEPQEEVVEDKNVKKVVLDEREGLIERFDVVLVDKKGRQLLREQY